MRTNDLILKTTTTIIAFVILAFSFYLLMAGHNSPGGGFVGGLMTSGAIVLMYISYGFGTMQRILKVNFRTLIPLGMLLAAVTGIVPIFLDQPFLDHTFDYFHLPILGKTELATATIFDLGVYLTVVGVTMTIMLSIANDQ